MSKVLIIFAHPLVEKSRVQSELIRHARMVSGVTVNDIYERYPDFDIDIDREKELLLAHDIIIWQHPFYWYSAPPLLKQWQDLVLEHGWAYGKKGTALAGKKIFNVFSSGGGTDAYREGGFNKYPIHEYLRPFERTATLCRMSYWPPFWVHGVHKRSHEEISRFCSQYRNILTALTTGLFAEEEVSNHDLLNNMFPFITSKPDGSA
ncbi:MAG: NAD(P)H oxidoreductase [Sphingobacteriales bacterium]|nr:MAG: NAD(P)H oxidoreductase [Sphingobacteriales bacterium]